MLKNERQPRSQQTSAAPERSDGVGGAVTYQIIGAAQKVHRTLGPGFTEGTYQAALAKELMLRGIPFESQKEFEVFYEGVLCGTYRVDLAVGGQVALELKATSDLNQEQKAQTISYLKASGLPVGLLINFGAPSLQVRRYDKDKLK